MLSMKEWMELVEYKITEGCEYGWHCFGPNAYQLDSWNGIHGNGGYSSHVVFDTEDQTVYEVSVCDYTNNRAYRMIAEEYQNLYRSESEKRGLSDSTDEAWDGVNYIDLDVDDDFIQKFMAIKDGEDYDTRVSVPIELPDDELLFLMKMAHDQDITFNQLMINILTNAAEEIKRNSKNIDKLL
jgi:hypothetical protein